VRIRLDWAETAHTLPRRTECDSADTWVIVLKRWAFLASLGPTLLDRTLAEIVAARAAAPGLEGAFAGHSLRFSFRDGGRTGRSLRGRDHAPWALEQRADRPPLHPPGLSMARQSGNPTLVCNSFADDALRAILSDIANRFTQP
jgi:hypothetical protein